ncbi:MAG: hypothetical protein ABSD67_02050 [Terracidiphilus sp.]
MTKGLVRYQQCGCFHFLTFSCDRGQPLLDSPVKPLEAIPFIGNFALGYDTYDDLKETSEKQSSCVDSGKYD